MPAPDTRRHGRAFTCDEPPAVAGHLLGGAIAARFAARYPTQPRRLILVDTFGLSVMRPSPRFTFAMVRFIARPTEGTQRGLMTQCMADLDTVRNEMDGDLDKLEAYALDRTQGANLQAALRRLMPKFGIPAIPSEELERILVCPPPSSGVVTISRSACAQPSERALTMDGLSTSSKGRQTTLPSSSRRSS